VNAQAEAQLRSISMKKKLERRETELKAELEKLKNQRRALKEDMKKLKRELEELKGSTLHQRLDDGDDGGDDNERN
jgi:predicted  nucleic acid-binding Zn-ribbon protein